MTFSRDHFSTLIKYVGISFITGAISHGAFSGTRSLLTGTFGIFCFIVGTLMEKDAISTGKAILIGAALAVAIGAVTGGLQHFPDSPERSLMIIPIGYMLSLGLFAYIHKYTFSKKEYFYSTISSVIVLAITIGIYLIIENTGITGHTHGPAPIESVPLLDPASSVIQDSESTPEHHH